MVLTFIISGRISSIGGSETRFIFTIVRVKMYAEYVSAQDNGSGAGTSTVFGAWLYVTILIHNTNLLKNTL